MTPGQSASFQTNGYLFLKGALGKDFARTTRTHILGELKKQNIWASGKTLSTRLRDMPPFQQITQLGQRIRYPDLQERMVAPDLLAKMETLAGCKLTSANDAQLLLSLPNQGQWALDGLDWHVDVSSAGPDRSPGIQAFALLDDLIPQGGATLALAGSHKLDRSKPAVREFQKKLKHSATRDMAVDGVDISILEMTGQAGDLYLMDMRLLHTPSINATKRPRLMATARYFTKQ
jgi:hypothetical protein